MARPVHWTHDLRFRHLRNPPAWYHIRSTPFFTPMPSARMEKQASADRRSQWLGQTGNSDGNSGLCDEGCLKATFWPCGVYARTSSRLRCALGGRDALHPPKQGACNSDCCQYAACLPFSGCLLARAQTTVRSFYGIDGTDTHDWFDGFCCPCFTLVRNEQEIIFREKQHDRLRSLHEPDDQYQPSSPMSYEEQGSSFKSRTDEPKGKQPSKRSLTTIAEGSREPSVATRRGSAPAASEADAAQKVDAAETDPSGSKPFPLLRYLDQMWYLVPAINDENAKPSEEGHGLADDEVVSVTTQEPHNLNDDVRLAAELRNSKFREHLLEDDTAEAAKPTIQVSHTLDTHTVTAIPAKSMSHDLSEDVLPASIRAKRRGAHTLEDDDRISVAQRILKHHLESHEPIVTTTRSVAHRIDEDEARPVAARSVAHVLDQDETAAAASRIAGHALDQDETAPTPAQEPEHGLDEHEETPGAWPVATPHGLNDDA